MSLCVCSCMHSCARVCMCMCVNAYNLFCVLVTYSNLATFCSSDSSSHIVCGQVAAETFVDIFLFTNHNRSVFSNYNGIKNPLLGKQDKVGNKKNIWL